MLPFAISAGSSASIPKLKDSFSLETASSDSWCREYQGSFGVPENKDADVTNHRRNDCVWYMEPSLWSDAWGSNREGSDGDGLGSDSDVVDPGTSDEGTLSRMAGGNGSDAFR